MCCCFHVDINKFNKKRAKTMKIKTLKKAITATALLSLASCTTLTSAINTERQEIVGLHGISLDYLEQEWGKAESTIAAPDGTKILMYEKVKTTTIDPLSDAETNHSCTIKIILDTEGLVKDWEHARCLPPLTAYDSEPASMDKEEPATSKKDLFE